MCEATWCRRINCRSAYDGDASDGPAAEQGALEHRGWFHCFSVNVSASVSASVSVGGYLWWKDTFTIELINELTVSAH